jgi:hypothetical protein
MDDMRARIARGDIDLERGEAIKVLFPQNYHAMQHMNALTDTIFFCQAMCDIAVDRASKLQ